MQRNFKFILALIVLTIGSFNYAQQKDEYKDVVLDGKPAKLNVTTGEITLVNSKDKRQPVKLGDSVATKAKDTLQSNDKNAIAGLHVVQEGETLFDISKYYNVSLDKLKKENNLETTLISKGQVLKVKNFDAVDSTDESMRSKNSIETFKELNTSGYHIVKSGETLYSIAKSYNVDLEALRQFNELKSDVIKVGQRIRLTKVVKAQPTENLSNDGSYWTVSKGDTLFSIAKKNGLTVDGLKQLNGLTENTIYIGQKLRLN